MKHITEDVDKVLLEKDLFVAHKMDYVHFMDKPHFHDGFEIHFTLTNATTYQIDERVLVADAGSVALFSPEEIHRVSIDRDKLYERYFLLFKPRFIDEMLLMSPFLLDIYFKKKKRDCIQLSVAQQVKFKNIFDELIELMDNDENTFSLLRAKLKLTELLVLLTELSEGEHIHNSSIVYENNQVVVDIVTYMKENFMNDITLDLLSDVFFVSKSTIIRLFKSVLGMTPTQYLIYVRIMKSRSYLEKGLTVKEVSEKVGYKDESSFIKKFKELQGISPKQYILKQLESKK